MLEIRKFNSIPGIILFVLQSYSFTIFLVNADSMATPERWATQYITFSAIVLLLTFVLLHARDIIYKSSLILLIQIITGMMIRPLIQQPMIIYSLLISETLLFFIVIPNLFSLFPTLSLIFITVASLHLPMDNWKNPFEPPDSVTLMNMIFLPLLTFAVVSYANHRKKSWRKE